MFNINDMVTGQCHYSVYPSTQDQSYSWKGSMLTYHFIPMWLAWDHSSSERDPAWSAVSLSTVISTQATSTCTCTWVEFHWCNISYFNRNYRGCIYLIYFINKYVFLYSVCSWIALIVMWDSWLKLTTRSRGGWWYATSGSVSYPLSGMLLVFHWHIPFPNGRCHLKVVGCQIFTLVALPANEQVLRQVLL